MILRQEFLLDTGDERGTVVVSVCDHANLGGWPDVATASRELRRKADWLDPEPLVCGGYETRESNPNTAGRERVTFWADVPA